MMNKVIKRPVERVHLQKMTLRRISLSVGMDGVSFTADWCQILLLDRINSLSSVLGGGSRAEND